MKTNQLVSFVALISIGHASLAEVKPNALFSNNAVLQQGQMVPVWGSAKDNEKVTVSFAGQTVTTRAKGGRWLVQLKPLRASADPQVMTITGENRVTVENLLVGEVWVASGQSNMEMGLCATSNAKTAIAESDDGQLRLLTVPRTVAEKSLPDVNAAWTPCSPKSVERFSAVAYFFGRDLRKSRGVPVGLIVAAWGGTGAESWTPRGVLESQPQWMKNLVSWEERMAKYDPIKAAETYKLALVSYEAAVAQAKTENKPAPAPPRAPTDPRTWPIAATRLYNGMIAPLMPFAIKGVIWYQGEANNGRAKDYQMLFPAMIKGWRDAWQQDAFPFLFVQIAPFKGMCPEIREAQLLTLRNSPNTAMVVTTDYGDPENIHPRQKEPVGARLALAARALAYGEKVEYSGPAFVSMELRDGAAVLKFEHANNGLVAKGGELKGFTIAGAAPASSTDSIVAAKKFVPAVARIVGDTVEVSSAMVPAPAVVRYGWENVPDVNLFNTEGLPASPFRTDEE